MRAVPFILARGRDHALSRMTSRCTIWRRGTLAAQDEDTGAEVRDWDAVYEDLPCRISATAFIAAPQARRGEIAGGEFSQAVRIIHVPVTTTNLKDGDLIEMTVGDLTGVIFRLSEATSRDHVTARRMPIVEVDRPEELT